MCRAARVGLGIGEQDQPAAIGLGDELGEPRSLGFGVGPLAVEVAEGQAIPRAHADGVGIRHVDVRGLALTDEAYERILPHLTHQLNSYRHHAALGGPKPARMLTEDEVRERGSGVIKPLQVLTPEQTVAHVRELSDGLPVEHVYFWASVGGMPEDLVERQMELLIDEVQPALRRS